MMRLGLLLLVSLPLLVGCVGRSYVAMGERPDERAGSLEVTSGAALHVLEQPGEVVGLVPYGRPVQLGDSQLQFDFRAALEARPPAPERFLVYLERDGRTPMKTSETALDGVIQAALQRDYPLVRVIGHTDTLGYRAANLQVGLVRARRVAGLLTARGLKATELQVSSHGELDLLVKTPDATAEPRNRRVEVYVR